jgi:hypothetical protein
VSTKKLDLANHTFDVGYMPPEMIKMRSDSDDENKIWRESEVRLMKNNSSYYTTYKFLGK